MRRQVDLLVELLKTLPILHQAKGNGTSAGPAGPPARAHRSRRENPRLFNIGVRHVQPDVETKRNETLLRIQHTIIHRTNMVQGQILEREVFPIFVGTVLAEHLVGKLCNSLRAHGRKIQKSHYSSKMRGMYGVGGLLAATYHQT